MKRVLGRILIISLILSLSLLVFGAAENPAASSISTGCGSFASMFSSCNPQSNYVTFGEFPQTIKKDNVTITSEQDSRGYYLGSDGEYYAKTTVPGYANGEFSTGEDIRMGYTYYFKVEPIKWKVLTKSNGKAFILSDKILIAKDFDEDNNNYANSDIREWLNGEFYTVAFSFSEQNSIKTTEVDNSASTTQSPDENEYACENTFDKVFLLSYQDMLNTDYGFNSAYSNEDKERRKIATDYAKALGAETIFNENYCAWYLRSPRALREDSLSYVDCFGSIDGATGSGGIYYNGGIVPAMYIELED